MNIRAFWDDERNTTIRFHYRRPSWDWHDFYAALEVARGLLHEADRPIGFIVDIMNGGLTPGIFISQSKILYEIKQHPLVRVVVVAGSDPFIEALYNASSSESNKRDMFKFTYTTEEARELVEKVLRPKPQTGMLRAANYVSG